MTSSFAATRIHEPNSSDRYQNIRPATIRELDPPSTSEIAKAFKRQKTNKTTIEGSLPSEVWKIMYQHCSPLVHLIKLGPLAIVKKCAAAPLAWTCNRTWPIDKKNGKKMSEQKTGMWGLPLSKGILEGHNT